MVLEIDKIIRTRRKTIALEVDSNARLIIRAPAFVSDNDISRFVDMHNGWIIKKKQFAQEKLSKINIFNYSYHDYPKYKKSARLTLKNKCLYWVQIIGVEYSKLKISTAARRWGSCSSNKVISLNWRLIFAPQEVIDYVVIHELCHIRELNHSRKFWDEVSKFSPMYKYHRKWLNDNSHLLTIDLL